LGSPQYLNSYWDIRQTYGKIYKFNLNKNKELDIKKEYAEIENYLDFEEVPELLNTKKVDELLNEFKEYKKLSRFKAFSVYFGEICRLFRFKPATYSSS